MTDIQSELQDVVSSMSLRPEMRDKIRSRLLDLSDLILEQSRGVDVSDEIEHVVAQIEMIAGIHAQRVKDEIRQVIDRWIAWVVDRLLQAL